MNNSKTKQITRDECGADIEYTAVQRRYKDTVFRMLVTLENAIYMEMKNDLAFVIDFQLHLYEHQSTVNPNMPLRFLQYVSKEYEKLTVKEDIYGGRQIMIPSPRFVVFYNGTEHIPDESFLQLSDAFLTPEETPWLELIVRVLNINIGRNRELMEQCRTLREYAQYVACVRKYARDFPIDRAVDLAVEECSRERILADFLQSNKAEVKAMSIFEYDDEATKKAIAANSFEDGLKQGREESTLAAIKSLLASMGWTAQQAMDALNISEADRVSYMKRL